MIQFETYMVHEFNLYALLLTKISQYLRRLLKVFTIKEMYFIIKKKKFESEKVEHFMFSF